MGASNCIAVVLASLVAVAGDSTLVLPPFFLRTKHWTLLLSLCQQLLSMRLITKVGKTVSATN